jgi:hypothetical protein
MDQRDQHSTAELSTEDFGEQRAAPRASLLLVAQFRVGENPPAQVRVRNLSIGGLMAEHAEPLARGTPVAVEVRGIGWVSGRVAWSAEGRVGVGFDQPIDPLLARKPASRSAGTAAVAKRC